MPSSPCSWPICDAHGLAFDLLDGGVFGEEDLFISEQIQLGLNSGANESFVLGRFEHHLRRYHGHIERMLKD